MGKDKKMKIIRFSIMILFLSLWVTGSVFAYGGGGGDRSGTSDDDMGVQLPDPPKPPDEGGGGGGDGGKESDRIKKYTRDELKKFFSGLPDDVVDRIISKQEGKPRTFAQLNLIRGLFLDAEKWTNQSEADVWQSYEGVAVVLDKTGQSAEMVLGFATGGTSNIVTGTLFGATRAGINAVNEGKTTADIIQAIAVTVAVDKIMNKVEGLKKLGDRGGQLVDMVTKASQLNKNPAVAKYLIKTGIKAGIYKEGEALTKEAIGAILGYVGDEARKAAAAPTGPPTETYTPTPIAGGTPRI